MNKITVVTEPDFYFMDQPTILSVGVPASNENICRFLEKLDFDFTIYIANENSSAHWLLNALHNSNVVLLDTNVNKFITGLLIDKTKTYYYNNKVDYSFINIQYIEDPVGFLIEWIKSKEE
jgi:hypothetical protein